MKKRKLLVALILCTAISIQVSSANAEEHFYEGTYTVKTTGNGGAIYNNSGDSAIINAGTQFISNEAKRGAAIYNDKNGYVSIGNGSVFESNSVKDYGGAIYNTAAEIVMGDNITFNNNRIQARGYTGGAIYGTGVGSITMGSEAKFSNNYSISHGGAICIKSGQNLSIRDNAKFINNSANGSLGNGGAIYSYNTSKTTTTVKIGNNAEFSKNTAVANGGAIYNGTNYTLEIGEGATFSNNVAAGKKDASKNSISEGGAIYNIGSSISIGDNAKFISNSAARGGAIMQAVDSALTLNNAVFNSNIATGHKTDSAGGAIFLSKVDTKPLTITNSTFDGNKSDVAGGAIFQADGSKSEISIYNTSFSNNETRAEGGAIVSDSILKVINSTFSGNKTTGTYIDETNTLYTDGGGGAIFLYDEGQATISGSNFENNSSGTYGGAISTRIGASNDKSSLTIEDSSFTGNSAAVNGGAVAAFIDATITDTNFTNNTAGEQGGAVWANQNLTVNAVDSDVVMAGNSAKDGSDIFMNTEGSNLNMNAAEGKSITVASGISGNENGYNMLVNANGGTGSMIINSAIKNAAIDVQNGTFHLAQGSSLNNSTLNMASGTTLNTINNQISSFGDYITLQDNVNLAVDVNVGNNTADNFAGANIKGQVSITNYNPIVGNAAPNSISMDLRKAVGLENANIDALIGQNKTVLTPVRYLQGGVSETGILTMAPTGNGYKDFNPAIMASPVAAQLGGYLTQLNSYDEAFRNMDMYMLMTKKQRQAMKLRNKYAAADSNLIFDPTGTPYNDKAVWVRPYATFENVPLKGGPKVSNVAYGSFFGGESELYDLGHGWDGMVGVYAGYNGSHQAYDGISIYQNGGTLGLVGMAYKGNFFTGLTVNAGANAGEANTAYGTDNFSMLMAGIANKTGYNIELADGKFIIQPNIQLSYSFVNTFDYTNAAGVHMNSDPLNAIQVEPGIKFIGNLKNGWQPYAGVSVVWNIIDKTKFQANDVSLPELSVKPYVRYGVGVRKTWGEVCTGFLQAFITNGGRNGVGLQAGFRFTLGKGGLSSLKTSNNMPELPKTQINLSSAR